MFISASIGAIAFAGFAACNREQATAPPASRPVSSEGANRTTVTTLGTYSIPIPGNSLDNGGAQPVANTGIIVPAGTYYRVRVNGTTTVSTNPPYALLVPYFTYPYDGSYGPGGAGGFSYLLVQLKARNTNGSGTSPINLPNLGYGTAAPDSARSDIVFANTQVEIQAGRNGLPCSAGQGSNIVACYLLSASQTVTVEAVTDIIHEVANPAAIHPNQQVIFTASRDDGGPLNISTWYWQPDPGKPGSAGTACGWAANPSCQKQVAGSGTMTVYADVGYATAHVIVYTNFTLDVDQSTVNFGNIATFTPKYDGVPGPAARWRFDPSDTTTHDTQACESGVSQCQKVMLTTGRMWAFTSLTPGQGDSDSKVVTVKEPKLYLRALTRSGAKGRTVTFEPNWSDDTTVTAATWAWAPDTLPASTAACSGSPASCQAVIQQNGTMTATVSRQGITRSASAHVTIIPCPTKDTIADNMEVRDMLQDLFTSNHLGQPPENRREQIATIFYNPRTGEYRTQADYNHPNGTGYWCSTQPTWAPLRLENDPDSLFQQIALGHNHPVDPGKEDVPPDGVCNKEFQRRTPFAGPSPHDDDVAATGYPEFIIDATNIYRTDGPGKRQTWPHSGSCKLLTPHTLNLRPIGKPLIPQAPSVRSPNPNR